ncbi:MAG: thiamine pyrophosphate-dependent enzyme [Synergistales bacterium]
MNPKDFDVEHVDLSWCPGCGNFQILSVLKEALAEMGLRPQEVVLVSGIGQAAKTPHFVKGHIIQGLHGRAIPVATGVKAANPRLTVLAIGGDGDMYGEGGNHLLHAIRRNPDLTILVHNNMVYGLTKGQASPTSPVGLKTPVQVDGVFSEPLNPIALAVSQGASFVARTFSGELDLTREVIQAAIRHKGFSLVDIFQPCVSFNKLNTHKWFRENTFLRESRPEELHDRSRAMELALSGPPYPLGILYRDAPGRTTFEDQLQAYRKAGDPLWERTPAFGEISAYIEGLR